MEDTRKHANTPALALELAALLEEHSADNVAVLDFRALSMWTDFFVIGTVTSRARLNGLKRRIGEFAAKNKMPVPRKSAPFSSEAGADGIEWDLTDMGAVVVHLMTEKARAFYELERLWSAAERLT